MNKALVGSRNRSGNNFSSVGMHGLEGARMAVRCEEGSVMVDLYNVREEVHVDLWLSSGNVNRPADTLLFAGKLSNLLECNGLYWQPDFLEKVFSEAVKIREEAAPYHMVMG